MAFRPSLRTHAPAEMLHLLPAPVAEYLLGTCQLVGRNSRVLRSDFEKN